MPVDKERKEAMWTEEFNDFFEHSLCGYVITDATGIILRANGVLAKWMEQLPGNLHQQRFADLLTIGGKIYYETHLGPLLRMQGYFDEVALELRGPQKGKVHVFVNALRREREAPGQSTILFTLFKATDRQRYEENLLQARTEAETNLTEAQELATLREQFIAVLGHDLRNPLGAIVAGGSYLTKFSKDATTLNVAQIISRSADRMKEMTESLMDFAIARLGGGMVIFPASVNLTTVLQDVVDELKITWKDRLIQTSFDLQEPVICDAARLSQLFSNLLGNALSHGDSIEPVKVFARAINNSFELSVTNSGPTLSAEEIPKLFKPFKKKESRPDRNGLGLGLYIAAEIARAHGGTLEATSSEGVTVFVFKFRTGN